ncbi:hypothetical protein AB4071_06145 [Stenotrophomonas sp. 2MCAF14_2]
MLSRAVQGEGVDALLQRQQQLLRVVEGRSCHVCIPDVRVMRPMIALA